MSVTHEAGAVFFVPGRYKLTFHGSPHMLANSDGANYEEGTEEYASSAPDKKVLKLPPKFFPCPLLIEVV